MSQVANVVIVDNPMIQLELTVLRDVRTERRKFKRAARRLAWMLACEVGRDFPTLPIKVETVLGEADGRVPRPDKVVIATILRAALGMDGAFDDFFRADQVLHLGLCRDESTAKAQQYYPTNGKSIPSLRGNVWTLLTDPMLATGGSALMALDLLKKAGATEISMACVVAAPEGLQAVHRKYPDVRVYTCAVDERLNEKKYIVPGLGDFGDRLYGTL